MASILPAMDPVLVLRHGPNIPAGRLGEVLAEAAVPVATVALDAGGELPDRFDWAAVVSLGGVMGAYQEDRYPFLVAEKRFLRAAAAEGLPVLGICLGCQLLADALGGRAFKADAVEMGVFAPELSEAGRADPVVGRLAGPVLVWHEDTWEPPPGAEVLASSPAHPQAFRRGDVIGIQPHPEVTPEIVAGWVLQAPAHHFEEAGLAPEELLDRVATHDEDSERVARDVFGAWVDGI